MAEAHANFDDFGASPWLPTMSSLQRLSPTLWNQMERVEAEIAVRAARLRVLTKDGRPIDGLTPRGHQAVRAADELLQDAKAAARRNNQQGAWFAMHDVDEELVWTLSREETVALGQETAAKLAATRGLGREVQGFVAAQAKDLAVLDDETAKARVRKIMELRHQHWEVSYHASATLVGRVSLLVAVLAVALGGVLVLSAWPAWALKSHMLPVAGLPDPFDDSLFTLAVVAFGALGGAASSLLSAAQGDRILPDAARAAPWQFARPLFGATAALLVVMLLSSNALGLGVGGHPTLLAYAAAAGFSELLLVKLMGRMAEKAEKADEAPAKA